MQKWLDRNPARYTANAAYSFDQIYLRQSDDEAARVKATPSHAHELRPGYLEFSENAPGTWTLVWKAPMRGGLTPQTQPVLPKDCKVSGEPSREISGISPVTTFSVACKGDVWGNAIGLSNFEVSQTDVLVRVQPLGRPVQPLRLTPAAPKAEIKAKPDR